MCELLGFCFNKKIGPYVSFRGFRKRGKDNPDGWGIGYYPDCASQVIKEPLKANKSELAEFVEEYSGKGKIKSKIIISHVRARPIGGADISFRNTHPFKREIFGKEYIFAHNGTVDKDKIPLDKSSKYHPVGETDSERVFCYLLNLIYERGIRNWNEKDFKWLSDILKELNRKGSLNLLFSDGKHLFAYHDANGYKSLHFLERKPPYGEIKLKDEDFVIDLSQEKSADTKGFIVATEPLTNEKWEEFKPGELIIFRDGEILWSSERKIEFFTKVEKQILRVLRKSPHRVNLKNIIGEVNYPENKVKSALRNLITGGYVKQDSRDRVEWDNPFATFYTNPEKRDLIDKIIKKQKGSNPLI